MASDRICLVCGRKSTLFNTCLKLSEGRWICSDCKLYTGVVVFSKLKKMTDDEIIEAVTTKKGGRFKAAPRKSNSLKDKVNAASGAGKEETGSPETAAPDAEGIITVRGLLGEVLTVDRSEKKLSFQAAPVSRKEIPVPAVYDYEDIIGYELIKDTTSVMKRTICRTLKVRITVQDERARDIYIHILNNDHVFTGSDKYKRSEKTAKHILMLLQMICKGNEAETAEELPVEAPAAAPAVSPDTENVPELLREYKKLLDEGVITEEEFEAKKAQLLGV